MATATEAPVSADFLNSWKEIAGYLSRGIRTVQRWESELGLPVRRPRGGVRGSGAVIARRSELDDWLIACPLSKRERNRKSPFTHHIDLISQSRLLILNMQRTRIELQETIHRVTINVARLRQTRAEHPK